ncbi:malto-oligosyltrehalose trehalohydrolase [Acidisphaera sp. L21]|uniref:malto-oligosyltrehalose trehalohydrolase n=1 Tax=Acidisphaera sp. L21 TaxID=1641851 RepID=UPI00131B8233|nr:malto-oligosyltrehalose trehalohydrolase [Acidisphaera sp. L21]
MTERFAHPLPFGAELLGNLARFRIWAPSAKHLVLELDGVDHAMTTLQDGWHEAAVVAEPGARYRYRMPDGMAFPDPASRAQAGDVHDPSLLVDPRSFEWKHGGWKGRPWHEAVVYELHPGAFGGFDGIRAELPRLAALGVTAVELMPIADFPGAHNWGYDGVLPYAPDAAYGTPDQLKAMIDAAHGLGLMVMLDVVYNHFGPDGAYIHAFAKPFFRDDKHTPWGAAIDFCRPEVRQYFEQNALYWLHEYRFDGLRFDAVHAIDDPGFLDEMAAVLRSSTDREIHLVLEHEGNAARHLRANSGGPGFDAQWTDDVHHCLHVLLTGESEGYYEDFDDPIHRLARAMAEGFVYQGEVSKHSGKPRGEPSAHLPTTAFVICLQNHDQIGNRAMGERLTQLAEPGALRAATVLLLLSPFVPMLFMGEEVASTAPFLFFTAHNDELAELVREGRRAEFKHFAAFQDPERREKIPDPNAPATFRASVPELTGDSSFITKLLAVRAASVVPGIPGCRSAGVTVLGHAALVARWRLGTGATLAIAINLGDEKPTLPMAAAGDTIFESPIGAWDAAMYGTLLERSAVAWIEPSL